MMVRVLASESSDMLNDKSNPSTVPSYLPTSLLTCSFLNAMIFRAVAGSTKSCSATGKKPLMKSKSPVSRFQIPPIKIELLSYPTRIIVVALFFRVATLPPETSAQTHPALPNAVSRYSGRLLKTAGVGVAVGVAVAVGVGVAVDVGVSVSVGVLVGVSVGVLVFVGVDVGVEVGVKRL